MPASALGGFLGEALRHPVKALGAVARRALEIPSRGLPRLGPAPADDFDRRLGVDTARIVQLVSTASPNAAHGNRYEASSEGVVRWAIEHCGLDLATATFIDVGCGKGRPLIVAADYPFRRIVGVEYSPELVAICRRNLAALGLTARAEAIHTDAADYRPPAGPILAFFYNPFSAVVQAQVLANLRAAEGPIVVAHFGPGQETVLEAGGVEFARGEARRLYRLPAGSQG